MTGTALVLVVTVLALVWSAETALRRDLQAEAGHAIERNARVVGAALPADRAAWQGAVRGYAAATGYRITLVDSTGRVIADSDFPSSPLSAIENHAGRPEVRAALAGRRGTDIRRSATVGRELIYVAIPGGPGAVRVAADLAQVDAMVKRAQRGILAAAALALAVGLLVAGLAAASVARPLTALAGAARAIASGAPPRFPRSGIAEIDTLVRALREMHQQLGDRFAELRREKAESGALVESMVEGVIAADARGRITTCNTAARRLLGYADDASLPDLPELFRAKSAREVVDAALAGRAAQSRTVELDGRVLLINARALPAGGAMMVLHDLTEMRRLETVRRDFVANVSHELRTPLTSISGYSETLLTDSPDPATTRRFLETILSNAQRMQRLVDDLLDLARIESGRWQPEPEAVDAAAMAHEVWTVLGGRDPARTVTFTAESDPGAGAVRADPDALRQVLTNLIDNSLRHTPPGGRITVRVRQESGGTAVSVADSGAGIGREHLPRIFERFYRADAARSREEGGTGLGLAIVKHLVEAHGGHVAAESGPGEGTLVTCWFPA
jgi:two-component system phosphate regulon sensor histidine kinase PhoR